MGQRLQDLLLLQTASKISCVFIIYSSSTFVFFAIFCYNYNSITFFVLFFALGYKYIWAIFLVSIHDFVLSIVLSSFVAAHFYFSAQKFLIFPYTIDGSRSSAIDFSILSLISFSLHPITSALFMKLSSLS
jgi:hypothetical protein